MLYALFGALILLAAQQYLHGRQAKAERAHHSKREDKLLAEVRDSLAQVRELTNQIVLLKVEPQQAAVLSYPETEDDPPTAVYDDSLAGDRAWAEYIESLS